jgi:hypothetical protein
MPPFDLLRWSFYLVAAVILAYVVIVVGSVVTCWWNLSAMIEAGRKCDAENRLSEALAAALAAALALFAGARNPPRE